MQQGGAVIGGAIQYPNNVNSGLALAGRARESSGAEAREEVTIAPFDDLARRFVGCEKVAGVCRGIFHFTPAADLDPALGGVFGIRRQLSAASSGLTPITHFLSMFVRTPRLRSSGAFARRSALHSRRRLPCLRRRVTPSANGYNSYNH